MGLSLERAERRLQETHGSHLLARREELPCLFGQNEVAVVTARWDGKCILEGYIDGKQQPRVTETDTLIFVRDGDLIVHAGSDEVALSTGKSYEIFRRIPHFAEGTAFVQMIHTPATNAQNFRLLNPQEQKLDIAG